MELVWFALSLLERQIRVNIYEMFRIYAVSRIFR